MSNVFYGVGTGLAVGVSIIVAGYYGAGDFENVKKVVNSSLVFSFLLGGVCSICLLLFADGILGILNTPKDLLDVGMGYYRIEMATLAFYYFNCVYVSIEKARGNSKMILIINMVLALTKIIIAAFFVFVLNQGIAMIAVSTLISNMVVTFIGIYRLSDKSDVFGLSKEYIDLKLKSISKIMLISLPVIAEKSSFSLGKTMINSIGAYYGTDVIGALGVSNSTSAIANVLHNANSDGAVTVIRQNIGASNNERAYNAFKAVLFINVVFGMLSIIVTTCAMMYFIPIFTDGDEVFGALIKQIMMAEIVSNLFLAMNSSVMSFLYALGRTKISFMINFSRLFVYRLPLLLFLRYCTDMSGGNVMGLLMAFSNAATGTMSIIIISIIIKNEFFMYTKKGKKI